MEKFCLLTFSWTTLLVTITAECWHWIFTYSMHLTLSLGALMLSAILASHKAKASSRNQSSPKDRALDKETWTLGSSLFPVQSNSNWDTWLIHGFGVLFAKQKRPITWPITDRACPLSNNLLRALKRLKFLWTHQATPKGLFAVTLS